VPRLAPPTRHVEPVAEQEEPEDLEAQDEPEEEREVVVHGELVAVEEPTIVMLHDLTPAPRLAQPVPTLPPPPRLLPAPPLEPLLRHAPRVEAVTRIAPARTVASPPARPARVDPPKVAAAAPPRVVSPVASNGGTDPTADKVVLKGLRVPPEAPRGSRLPQ